MSSDAGVAAALTQLARAHRILDREGHNDMSLGHLSLRDPDGRGFWLKRGNIGLEEVIGASDFLLLDFDGKVLDGDGVRHFKLTSDLVNTPELGRELAGALDATAAVLLKNHGAAFVGTDVREATLAGIFLEKAARVQLTLAASGLEHSHPGADEIRQKRLTVYPDRAVENFWQYYNRKLDRAEGTTS